jgi:AcrR family transcriptional regulator
VVKGRSKIAQAGAPKRGSYESGRKRTANILSAAKSILINGGYSEFTLRRIAREAGMELRHLQYYFNTKEQLLRALLDDVCTFYDQQLVTIASDPMHEAEQRFLACIDYLLMENEQAESNTIFFELWALACHDEFAERAVSELYQHYCDQISSLLKDMDPNASKAERDRKAILIVALIEGLTLFIGHNKLKTGRRSTIRREARDNILKIANNPL